MTKKRFIKALYRTSVSVLLVLILLPYVFLISTGGRLLSLLGYIGLIATLAECALIIIPLSQPRNHEDN
jgi:hypothetical protein